jgi:Protein of unknown function (DUF3040)
MSALSRKQRRVLRAMERSLREDDPEWVSLFNRTPVPSFQMLSARVCVVFLAIATLLILAALALDDGQMFVGAMSVLGLLPLVVVLLMVIDRHEGP